MPHKKPWVFRERLNINGSWKMKWLLMTFSLPMNYAPGLFFMAKTETWPPWKFTLKLKLLIKPELHSELHGLSWNWLMHNNFKVRIVRLFESNTTFILVTCTSGDQGYDPCMAFPEWICSSKKLICRLKKNIVMPIKHHFGKIECLKINLTETMHSFCRIVFRKAYISYRSV